MNNYKDDLKGNLLNTIFSITGKTWLNITYAYTIYLIITIILIGIAAAITFTTYGGDISSLTALSQNPSPEEILPLLKGLSNTFLTPTFIILGVILFILMMVIISWNYYFSFITIDATIKKKNFSFIQLLNLSLNYGIVKMLGISFLTYFTTLILFIPAILISNFSGFLSFALFIIAWIVACRLILVIPAYAIGNKDLSTSFAFSFHYINWIRALKLFGISILSMIILIIISLIISLIGGMLSFIPYVGQVIQLAINTFFGAIMMAFISSSIIGLYYRYDDEITNHEPFDAIKELIP